MQRSNITRMALSNGAQTPPACGSIPPFVINGGMCYAVYTVHGRQHHEVLVTVVMCKMAELHARVAWVFCEAQLTYDV